MKFKDRFFPAFFCFLTFVQFAASGQNDSLLIPVIQIDTVTITEFKDSLRINDFIRLVENDTTFYQAFSNLHRISYSSACTVRMFDEDHFVQAGYTNRAEQTYANGCKYMTFPFEASTGDFFDKDGAMNYYTARMFSYIFLYRDTICTASAETPVNYEEDSKIEKHKEQLKKLIFNPGQPIEGIPFLKDRVEIFNSRMMQYYDYSISSGKYATGVDCYIFSVKKKESAAKGKDVIFNELTTWFDKKTFAIVAREYSLSCFNPVYDFDVSMQVQLTTIRNYRVPQSIIYNGFWDVPTKKPERGSIQIYIGE